MTAINPRPRAGVLDISAYVPGKSSAPGVARLFKLSSNETPLGPSPRAIAAYQSVAKHLEDYPDGSASELREAIAGVFGLDPERIICGAGSDDLFNLLARAYLADGDEAIHTTHGFLVYAIASSAAARPVVAPETDYTPTSTPSRRRSRRRRKSSSSPIRTIRPERTFRSTRSSGCTASLPPHVLLVLDAAYAEYVRRNDYESGIELVATNENVVMTRTFSKIHGLAALRLGWMFGPVASFRPSTASAGHSTSIRRRLPPASKRSGTRASGTRARAQRTLAFLAGGGNRKTGTASDAKRRQFFVDSFRQQEAERLRKPTPSFRRADSILRQVEFTGYPMRCA